MSGAPLKFASVLVAASLCLPGAVAQKGGVRKPLKKQQPAPPPVPPYTPAPLQPLPLDQVPAVAPKVSYDSGKLTIVAHNSTLADVLKSVKLETGAELEIPPNATERVVADIGPGRARDVLAELLNGTHFNYVIVGSSSDPTAVQSIFLTPKSGAPDAPATAANRGTGLQRFPNQPVATAPDADNDAAEDGDVPDDQPPAAATTDQPDQQNQNPAQQTPKTPEQLLQELQRQQQQKPNPQNDSPQVILPNQPPTAAPPNPNKPD
jgi:hypothetical protein